MARVSVASTATLDSLNIPRTRAQRDRPDDAGIRARNSSVRISQSRGDDDGDDDDNEEDGKATMLMPKSYSWKAASPRLPPGRQLARFLPTSRPWHTVLFFAAIVLLWRSMGSVAGEMQRYASSLPHGGERKRVPCPSQVPRIS